MKISFLLIMLSVLNVHAASIFSQNAKISVHMQDVTVREVFGEIEKQGGMNFRDNDNLQEFNRQVSVSFVDQPIKDILGSALNQADMKHEEIKDEFVVLLSKPDYLIQQQITVTGRVTDSNTGEVIPGVSIIIEGTTIGVVTDIDGNYEIDVPDKEAVLSFSFVGYQTERIVVVDQKVINVSLITGLTALDEIVVVGYGTQRRINLTGAVSNVRIDEVESRPIASSSTILQGTIPGVYALQVSGKPGEDHAVIDIRGVGTFGDNSPLILIDGMPGNINDVDARDIESISVLKDAASAAIYGNRAANGVIHVTTRRGSDRRMSLSYTGYVGTQNITRLPEVFNSVEYATLINEANVNSGRLPQYTDDEIQLFRAGSDWRYPDINYYDVYYDPASIQNHHFNVSGGSQQLHYAFMLGYLDQDGVLVATDNKELSFRSNFDAFFLDDEKLRLTARMSGNRRDRNQPTNEWNTKWYAGNAPVWPLKNPDDQYIAVIGERNFYGETVTGSTANFIRNNLNFQVQAELEVFEGLSTELTYGANLVETNSTSFNANVTLANLDATTRNLTSALTESNNRNAQTLFSSLIRFQKSFDVHEINFLAGYSEEEFTWSWNSGYRSGFINNMQRYLNLGDPGTMQNNAGAYDLGLQSVFGRLNYIYNQRYLFEANIRRDGSSRFGEGHKWGTFPSFSAGWIMTEEEFLRDISWLTVLKIRASWGRLGNQSIPSYYAASDILNVGHNYPLGGQLNSGVAITSMSNPATTWETAEQINVGVDLLINNNIDITVDYFNKYTYDILMQVPIPITMGNLTPPHTNVGAVENKGLEFAGNYRKTFANDLTFRGSLFFARMNNKVTDLYGRSPIINGVHVRTEGSALNSFYGYKVEGLYQIDDFTWQDNSNPNIPHEDRNYVLRDGVVSVANYSAQPGDLKFKDLSGDGIVTMANDRTVIGKQFPDWSFSLNLNANWKNFDLGVFFQGVMGIEGYNFYEIVAPFSNFSNTAAWWRDRWTPENTDTDIPRLTRDDFRNNIHSEFYMEDASYLRLKNVVFGYTLNPDFTRSIGLSSVRLFGNIQNAFTITNFKGYDPEQPVWETRSQAYPQVRIITFGVSANL